MPLIPTLPLTDGHHIPQLGLGVWQTPEDETARIVGEAFKLGYRHIDTAKIYKNEAGVGQAITASGVPRDELFITTKLWNSEQGHASTLKALETSLAKLKLDYVDLYLIHWPCPEGGKFVDTWKAMIQAQEQGKIRSIGVSNFRISDLEHLLAETGVVPAVNQIELHPLLQQRELRNYHQQHGIVTESWSPLAQGGELLKDARLQEIGKAHGKTAAQVILRWHIQLDLVVFPKSATPSRIQENADIFDFELSPDEISQITQLDAGTRLGPDPSTYHG